MTEYLEFTFSHCISDENVYLYQTKAGNLTASYSFLEYLASAPSVRVAKSTQTVEFVFDFNSYYETLICPVSKTTKFKMCLYDAYLAQKNYDFKLPEVISKNCMLPGLGDEAPTPTPAPVAHKFIVNVDGYCFSNSRTSFNYGSDYGIPYERYEDVFGPVGANTRYNPSKTWSGSCFGFSATTGLFFTNDLKVSSYKAKTVFEIPVPKSPEHEVTKLIEKFQICWGVDGVGNKANPKIAELIDAVYEFQKTGLNPVIIAVYRTSGDGTVGHALIGYSITQDSSGYTILLYDCNYPNDITPTLKIGLDKKTWDYRTYNSSDPKGKIYFLLSNNIGVCMAGHMGEAIGDSIGDAKLYLSISTDDVEIFNSNGIRVEEIAGVEKILMCDNQPHEDIAYYLPQDTYRIVPKGGRSKKAKHPFKVGFSDDETSILASNETAFEATIALGEEPQLDIEGGSGEFELNVVTTNKKFKEDKLKVYKRGGKSSTVSLMSKRSAPEGSHVRFSSDGMRAGKKNSKAMKLKFKME